MNARETGKRGALIKPSARKSIHSHRNCPFSISEHGTSQMGRYGLDNPYRSRDSPPEEGRDEVDNAMSKLAFPIHDSRQSSSKHIRRKRSSIDNILTNHYIQDDDYSNVLSKSLPTSLPSHSYYSDESSQSQDEGEMSYESGATVHNITSQSNSNEDSPPHLFAARESSVYPEGIRRRYQNQSPVKNRLETANNSSRMPIWPILFIIVILLPVIVYTNFTYKSSEMQHFIYDKNNFYDDIKSLAKKYKVNHESIAKVQLGISSILEKEDADSFIFVYNGDSGSFDQEEFNNFMDDIAHFTSKYLRNESASTRHIVIDGGRLNLHNSEELIDKYSEDISKTGVMLVKEIDAVPSSLAMAFHYYCDEYNPVAKKSAIFSTLDISKCSQEKSSTHAVLEKCLENKWKSIPADNMRPLLSRVVSVIIDVTNGF